MSSPFVHHNGEVRLVIQIPCFNEATELPATLADLPRDVPGFEEVRWLVIDEISTASPLILGLLDAYLRRACARHPYARRGQHRRPFGGINIVFAGDLWQLPPVHASAIFSNPFSSDHSSVEQKMFKMFLLKKKNYSLRNSKRNGNSGRRKLISWRKRLKNWEVMPIAP